jgi:hypothetical protein
MSKSRELPNPRKLYSTLRETPSANDRAQAVSDFLCSATGADAIHLFLARAGEPALVADSPSETASAEMLAEVRRAWNHDLERQPEDQKTKTLDVSALLPTLEPPQPWKSATGSYQLRLLSVYRNSSWVPVGVAMLKCPTDRPLSPIRQAHIEAICNALIDAGDVSDSPDPTPAS